MSKKEEAARDLKHLEIALVDEGRQYRQTIDEEAYKRLVHSVATKGLQQPVRVRRQEDGRYLCTLGQQRLRACRDAGQSAVMAVIDDREPDEGTELLEWLETNDAVTPLNDMDRAEVYALVMKMNNWSQSQLAREIGVGQATVSRLVQLTEESCPADLKEKVRSGEIPATVADEILRMPAKKQPLANKEAAAGNLTRAEAAKERKSANNPVPVPPPEVFFREEWTTDKRGRLGGCTISFKGAKGKKKYTPEQIRAEFMWVVDLLFPQPKLADLGDEDGDEGAITLPIAS